MTISLTSEQEAAIQNLVEAGLFRSKEAALAYSLRRLTEDAKKLEALRADIRIGIDQADRGELVSAEDVFESLKRAHEDQFGPQDWSG